MLFTFFHELTAIFVQNGNTTNVCIFILCVLLFSEFFNSLPSLVVNIGNGNS